MAQGLCTWGIIRFWVAQGLIRGDSQFSANGIGITADQFDNAVAGPLDEYHLVIIWEDLSAVKVGVQ